MSFPVFVSHLNLKSCEEAINALDIDIDETTATIVATSAVTIGPTLKLGTVTDVEQELIDLEAAIAAGNSGSAAASALVATNLSAYETSNDAAVASLDAALTSETAARSTAVAALNTTLTGLITTETAARASADTALAADLAAETSARQTAISGEAASRAYDVSSLNTILNVNRSFLLSAINTEKSRIDGILSGSSVSLDSLQEIVTAFQSADSSALATLTQVQSQLTALQATVDALTAE